MNSISKRFALWLTLLATLFFAGCASTVSIDPFRTRITAASAVSPGADGVTTTEAVTCDIKDGRRLTDAEVKYYTDPKTAHKAVDDGICKQNAKTGEVIQTKAVHGSPSLAGEVVKTTAAAATGNLANAFANRWLDKKRNADCVASGGCGTKIINNNLAYSEGGQGGRGGSGGQGGSAASLSQSSAGASASVESSGSGCSSGSCQ